MLARTACAARAIPSRTVLRGYPARKAIGTLARPCLIQAQAPAHLARSSYSTVAAEGALPTKKKVWDSVDEAVADIKAGDVVLSGGMWHHRNVRICDPED